MGKVKELNALRTKLTEEDLTKVQNLTSAINKTQFDIGAIEAQKHTALHSLSQLGDMMRQLREGFKETYGTDDINIQDGTINREENDGASDS